MSLLEVNSLKKIYSSAFKSNAVTALNNISFSVEEGEYIAIMGESGSGKSTLLNAIAALDTPTSGNILLKGTDFTKIPDHKMAAFRRSHLGFVFQDFHLLDTLTLEENIYLPLVLNNTPLHEMKRRLNALIPSLGIGRILKNYPYEVSGGQKQRAAVARALITYPDLILADEPTGALDSRSADELLNLFNEINENGQTIIMVTHSISAASHANRILFIKDGAIFHQIYRGTASNDELYNTISKTLTVLMSKAPSPIRRIAN
ncbi:putative ABC transport system ATP-binding protein [Lachnospiraceae bacterium KH1T2]|nr:putative ABC transport system ATP-binding protein [Lachnospiraceae bacterium KH1T2]